MVNRGVRQRNKSSVPGRNFGSVSSRILRILQDTVPDLKKVKRGFTVQDPPRYLVNYHKKNLAWIWIPSPGTATYCIPLQILGDCAGAAAPPGDHPRDERHGEGAPRHVLQVHRGLQATQDHHLQVGENVRLLSSFKSPTN